MQGKFNKELEFRTNLSQQINVIAALISAPAAENVPKDSFLTVFAMRCDTQTAAVNVLESMLAPYFDAAYTKDNETLTAKLKTETEGKTGCKVSQCMRQHAISKFGALIRLMHRKGLLLGDLGDADDKPR